MVSGADVFADYAYLSSTSGALVRHYRQLIDHLVARFPVDPGAVVVDVGANDGIMLDAYRGRRLTRVGVEPSSAGRLLAEKGYALVPRFFDREVGTELAERFGPAAILTATNVAAHVDDHAEFMAGFAPALAPDGVAVFEFSHLPGLVDGLYFDTIYHEHLCYWSLRPFAHSCRAAGLQVIDAHPVDFGASGPALRVYAARADGALSPAPQVEAMIASEAAWGVDDPTRYLAFAARVRRVTEALVDEVDARVAQRGPIAAFSAPAKGNTLLNTCRFGPDRIAFVGENNPRKIGTLAPGSHIPVVHEDSLLERGLDEALLLAWNYAGFFLDKTLFAKEGGRFLVPLPSPEWRQRSSKAA